MRAAAQAAQLASDTDYVLLANPSINTAPFLSLVREIEA
jgi:hypothetical protein